MSDSGKKAKPEKKRKDPNAPKKALTAYILFSNAKRAEVKKANPDIKFGDVAKEISSMWKSASSSEKAKYEKAAEADKVRYSKEAANYKGGAGAPAAKKAKAASKKAESESESESGSDEE